MSLVMKGQSMQNKNHSSEMTRIPPGSTIRSYSDGRMYITFPGALAAALCVQGTNVHRAHLPNMPVSEELARAALRFVERA